MTRSHDRRKLLLLVDEAIASGARSRPCAEVLGLSARTLRRWRGNSDDSRPSALRARPGNALSEEEQASILAACNKPEYKDKPPAQIVPELADQGVFIASESTFYRTLRANKQLAHRGRAREPRQAQKPVHVASAPNQVWVWDITYLKTAVVGIYFYLNIIMDLFSRKIVASEVWAEENAEHSQALLRRACLAESISGASPLVLHGDNGSPLKAGTVLALMHFLGIAPSHSRPRVSNDNAFAEALMRTAKYHPSLPPSGFADLSLAREWAHDFVHQYNHEHKHSSLKFVTPAQKHSGQDIEILDARKLTYQNARARNPLRWINQKTRDWSPVTATALTPVDDRVIERHIKKIA